MDFKNNIIAQAIELDLLLMALTLNSSTNQKRKLASLSDSKLHMKSLGVKRQGFLYFLILMNELMSKPTPIRMINNDKYGKPLDTAKSMMPADIIKIL